MAKSSICVVRVMGADGPNCHRITASPGAIAHRPIWATGNICRGLFSSGQPFGQLFKGKEAKAMDPAGVFNPRKVQLPGPLHISFCRVASKLVMLVASVLVTVQPDAIVD